MRKFKNYFNALFATIIAATILTGCGGGDAVSVQSIIEAGDVNQAREKRKELSTQQRSLADEISKLDDFINNSGEQRNIPLVTTFKVENKQFKHYIELQGDVTTKQNVLIYPEMAGTLLKVHVTKGQSVKKGQLLGTIDDGGMRNQLSQMKTQLSLAKTTFERQEKLWKLDIGSEIQYLQAKTNYEAQESAVKQMEEQLGKFSIRAPFTGIIDEVILDQGTVVVPGIGIAVFRIVNLSDMYLEVDVPESYVASITKGREVKVYFSALDETIDTYVRQTGNFINPDNRSFTAEIPVPNKGGVIKPNMTAKVRINDYTSDEAILIPQSVINENAEGEQYAFLAKDVTKDKIGKAEKSIITTGKTQGDYVEILTGISTGQNIIEEGARSVKDGQDVKIITQ